MKKRAIIAILTVALVAAIVTVGALAADMPFENLFNNLGDMFKGYTSDEGQILTSDYVSSGEIAVSEGETVWFGPCDPTQYFQLVGQNAAGEAVTDKIRGKELTVTDEFNNGLVIYQYTVPAGVSKLVFTAPADLADVYTISRSEITELTWRAYWSQQGKDPSEYVGESSYYTVSAGDKLYFGAITEEGVLSSKLYAENGSLSGTMAEGDLRLVESFGGDYGIYCYTVPADVAYVYVTYDSSREQYYSCVLNPESEETVAADFVAGWGIPRPLNSTVEALSGKSALFLGDSITFGARDRANIYGVPGVNAGAGGWAARIGYYTGMNVTNNGVSGACISTARVESSSEKHYIYNNLVATNGTTYDYVIMHGLFNDASDGVEVGTMQGKEGFDPAEADVTTYAGGLELLFYTARQQNPDAILGFIVNFHTERAVDQEPYVNMAIAICKDWGVPYLDLYHLNGFTVEFDDGLHPSSHGYDSMYTIVANWMATLDPVVTSKTASAIIMSYNVYYGAQDEAYPIADRYQKVADYIAAQGADIVLMQEYTNAFDTVARNTLNDYTIYGNAHPNYSDEGTYIAWKTAQYELIGSGCIEAPGEWCTDSNYPRAITWVVLKDKTTEAQLLVMDVHGQPDKSDGVRNDSARTKTMELVVENIALLRGEYGNIPVVVGGDFNMAIGSDAYNALIAGGLTDVRAMVNPDSIGSYNAWTRDEAKFAMGDYLFVSGDINAGSYIVKTDDVDADQADGTTVHISDHSPIVMDVLYN